MLSRSSSVPVSFQFAARLPLLKKHSRLDFPFLGEGSPIKIDYRKKGTIFVASLLEDLVDRSFGLRLVFPKAGVFGVVCFEALGQRAHSLWVWLAERRLRWPFHSGLVRIQSDELRKNGTVFSFPWALGSEVFDVWRQNASRQVMACETMSQEPAVRRHSKLLLVGSGCV